MAQRAAGEYDGGKIGFNGKRAPERLGDDHGLGEALAQAAMLLGKGHRQQAEVGVLLPQRSAVALGLLHVGEALVEIAIVGGKQSLEAVFELPLLVVEIEIHELCFSASPLALRFLLRTAHAYRGNAGRDEQATTEAIEGADGAAAGNEPARP